MMLVAGGNEVVNSRKLGYPRDVVFEAWTTADRIARWWGPKGFTNTIEEFDCRPGGQWRLVMHGPNGTNHPNRWVFEEIVPQERIVIRHLNVHEFVLTAIFEENEGHTLLTWRQQFMDSADFEKVKSFVNEANEQNLDRLNDLLAELQG